MPSNRYQSIKRIGAGGFSKIYSVRDKTNGKIYALKSTKVTGLTPKRKTGIIRECVVLLSISCKNIIQCHAYYRSSDDEYRYGILELCKGDLRKYINGLEKRSEKVPKNEAVRILYDISNGLKYMHERYLVHRDVKPENILFGFDDCVKLGDFGLVVQNKKPEDQIFENIGTQLYMAPEIVDNSGYSYPADMWAFACTIYELLFHVHPFDKPFFNIFEDLVHLNPVHLNLLMANTGNDDPYRELKRIALLSFDLDPVKRLTSKKALSELGKLKANPR